MVRDLSVPGATNHSRRLRSPDLSAAASGIDAQFASALPFSIFHEPWYLDIATGGTWSEAVVSHSGQVVGRLPYVYGRRYGLRVATLPWLVPTLGPAIAALPGKNATGLRRRLSISNALIDQLPELGMFEQVFDPRIIDAIAFMYRGFVVGTSDCFRIPAELTTDLVWQGMESDRREELLPLRREFRIDPIIDANQMLSLDVRCVPDRDEAERFRRLMWAASNRRCGCMLGAYDRTGTLHAALALVWDASAAYRLLSVCRTSAPRAAMTALLWGAICEVLPHGRALDFGSTQEGSEVRFLAGFGDYLTPRIHVRRVNAAYRLRKAICSASGLATR